jgi:hypothetical protein
VADSGASQLDDDAVTLGIVADGTHQLHLRPSAGGCQGHLHGQPSGSELAIGLGSVDARASQHHDHGRSLLYSSAGPKPSS